MEESFEQRITPPSRFSLGLGELWQYRELFYFFTWRDIKVKYKQTVLGFAWAVLQPLLMTIIFSVFFGRALKVPSDGIPYPIFAFSGLLFWNVFSTGLSGAGNSMVGNANIIKKIYFPRLVIPFSAILVACFDFVMAFVVFVGMTIFFGYFPPLQFWLLTPVCLLLCVLATTGPGLFIGALNVKYRDFRYVLPFTIQLLLFVTPVIYPMSLVGDSWVRFILALNPMYAPIALIRGALNNALALDVLVQLSLLSSVVWFAIGLLYFRKTEAYFADLA